MKLYKPEAEIFVADGTPLEAALGRVTDACVAGHPDDLEIMAYTAIASCFRQPDRGFLGIVASDGAGSPRTGAYGACSDAEMRRVRRREQRKAAVVGEYAAVALLDYTSAEVKDGQADGVALDIHGLLAAARPRTLYVHNLADRHDTHVATTRHTLEAVRRLPAAARPARVLGCEVWRDLDWLGDKVVMDNSERPALAAALLGVFDSQVAGGKRHDLATPGRRRAHATYLESHGPDDLEQVAFAMDLTPLFHDDRMVPADFVRAHLERFREDVEDRLLRLRRS